MIITISKERMEVSKFLNFSRVSKTWIFMMAMIA